MAQPTPPTRQLHLLMVLAYSALPMMLLVFIVPRQVLTASEPIPLFVYALGAVAFLGGVVFSMSQLQLDREPLKFQVGMVMVLGCFELPTLFGVFLGHSSSTTAVAPFVVASEVGTLLVVLPKVLAYWRTH